MPIRVGLVSDTHSYYHPVLDTVFKDVDLIIHAGDVGTPEILDRLAELAPLKAVWGNIDGSPIRKMTKEIIDLHLEDVHLRVIHIAGRPGKWTAQVRDNLAKDTPDILICGHSHILRVEKVDSPPGLLYINPGAAGRVGFHKVKTCMRFTVDTDRLRDVEVIHLDEQSQEDPSTSV